MLYVAKSTLAIYLCSICEVSTTFGLNTHVTRRFLKLYMQYIMARCLLIHIRSSTCSAFGCKLHFVPMIVHVESYWLNGCQFVWVLYLNFKCYDCRCQNPMIVCLLYVNYVFSLMTNVCILLGIFWTITWFGLLYYHLQYQSCNVINL